jgi:hypothetical protein
MRYTVSLLLRGPVITRKMKKGPVGRLVHDAKPKISLKTCEDNICVGHIGEDMFELLVSQERVPDPDDRRVYLDFSGWARLSIQAANLTDVRDFINKARIDLSLKDDKGNDVFLTQHHCIELEIEEIESSDSDDDDDSYHSLPSDFH